LVGWLVGWIKIQSFSPSSSKTTTTSSFSSSYSSILSLTSLTHSQLTLLAHSQKQQHDTTQPNAKEE
jgi:hypothetical protein